MVERRMHSPQPLQVVGQPKVGIILLNWNSWQETLDCLSSLTNLEYRNTLVVVVDNGSTNESVTRIRERYPDVRILETGANLGFAGGNNVGIRFVMAEKVDYVWLLNNDTVVTPDALTKLVETATTHPDHEFFGSWIAFHSDPDRLWYGGGLYSWVSGAASHEFYGEVATLCSKYGKTYSTSWVTGCSLLISVRTIERIGLLDESFFVYAEEMEWQLRGNGRRPTALVVGLPLVFHKVGRSSGSSSGYLGTVFMSRNHLKLALRYAGLACPLWLARWGFSYLLKPVLRRDTVRLRAGIQGALSLRTPGAEIVESILSKR